MNIMLRNFYWHTYFDKQRNSRILKAILPNDQFHNKQRSNFVHKLRHLFLGMTRVIKKAAYKSSHLSKH